MSAKLGEEPDVVYSSLGFKHSPSRNHFLNVGEMWLEDKRELDGAEGLWRIHDKLYDLDSFIDFHPGGKAWLQLTKGTDITEAFESHHITEAARNAAQKFYIREARTPRNSPFTFEENGFYKTLRRRVQKVLPTVPEDDVKLSKFYADVLFALYVTLAILAVKTSSFFVATITGVVLALLGNTAHNFFHQRDNFRMYYFDFTFMPSKSWRIIHACSHHMFPNTTMDLEISLLEPFLRYLPVPKNVFVKYLSWIINPFFCAFPFLAHFSKLIMYMVFYMKGFNIELLIPVTFFSGVIWLTKSSLLYSLLIWLNIQLMGSFVFMAIGLNVAHHHPEMFHDGDAPRPKHELDWGVHALDTTKDGRDFIESHFRVMTTFGHHTVHHLFPTIDHGKLKYLLPVVKETCDEFGIQFENVSQMELIKGQFLQLVKDEPSVEPPRPLRIPYS